MSRSKVMSIFLEFNRQLLFSGELGRPILPFSGNLYIQKKCLDSRLSLRHDAWGFSFKLGVFKRLAIQLPGSGLVRHLCKQVILPNPFFLFSWGKIVISQRHKLLLYDVVDYGLPEENRPASQLESQIGDLEDELGSSSQQRIHYLRHNMLTKIDSREKAILYKDKKTERLWQCLWRGQSEEAPFVLVEVTHPQWNYEYAEKRLGLSASQLTDTDFYESLEVDPHHKKCAEELCQESTIKHSSLCRDHHFESVMGRVYKVGHL